MNIKIKMPKFWRKIGWGGMAKELVLTFIGTTLSIVLTFGTAHYLEQKQLRADGRQTAMMVIHDMETCADKIESYVKDEEDGFQKTQYVIEHLDQIKSISEDTLRDAYFYITQTYRLPLYRYDDSNEKLFLSSQDVWKNINNATFMDLAQRFFYVRRNFYEELNNRDVFTKPISYDELIEYADKAHAAQFSFSNYLPERIIRPDVAYFLSCFQSRMLRLSEISSRTRDYAKRCKFIMDISDAELKAYLDERKHGGHPLKKRKMIGTWIIQENLDHYDYAELKADNSLISHSVFHLAHPYFVGRADFIYSYAGTWEIKGDSFIMCIDSVVEFALDTTQIHIIPDKEKEARPLIAGWIDYMKMKQEEFGQMDTIMRSSWAAYMDDNGEKIEIWRIEEESGEESCSYLIKK